MDNSRTIERRVACCTGYGDERHGIVAHTPDETGDWIFLFYRGSMTLNLWKRNSVFQLLSSPFFLTVCLSLCHSNFALCDLPTRPNNHRPPVLLIEYCFFIITLIHVNITYRFLLKHSRGASKHSTSSPKIKFSQ